MWLAGWVVRVLLLVIAPLYYLCHFVAKWISSLDEWAWTMIHARDAKKPPQSETAKAQPQRSAKKILP